MAFAVLFGGLATYGQHTVGLIKYSPEASEGYVLFNPISNTHTYLIDRCGREVNSWNSDYLPGVSAALVADGSLLRTTLLPNPVFGSAGGAGGGLEQYDWDGDLTWSYALSNDSLCMHHDFTVLPDGDIIVIAWERHDSLDAVLHGKNPTFTHSALWSERLIELQPVGPDNAVVVWQWRAWDHLVQDISSSLPGYGVIGDHPELMDINKVHGPPNSPDWLHFNSVSYNADLDQVMVSSHTQSEVWVIDHSTTTAEAAGHSGGAGGHGGDLLYRWGNPSVYDKGTANDQQLYGQHHATWIPQGYADAGDILVFNNGLNRPAGPYSSVEVIAPPVDGEGNYVRQPGEPYGPAFAAHTITAMPPTDLYSQYIGGVFPTEEGYLVTNGVAGLFLQFDANDSIIWQYRNPVASSGPMTQGDPPQSNSVFRCTYYPPDFSGFASRDLTPGAEIELMPTAPLCQTAVVEEVLPSFLLAYPNPTAGSFHVSMGSVFTGRTKVALIGMDGVLLFEKVEKAPEFDLDLSELPSGSYMLRLEDEAGHRGHRMVMCAQ